MTFSTRTFGVELEVFLPSRKTKGDLAAAIRSAARVSIRCRNYTHETTGHWKIVTDRSLGDYTRGCEVVSPVLSGDAGLREVRRVVEAMRTFGCTVNVRCGLHVHVGMSDYTPEQVRGLALYHARSETAIDEVMAPSRRGGMNGFIKSTLAHFAGSDEVAKFNTLCATLGSLDTIHEIIHRSCGSDRYRKLNFMAWHRQRTVEFRQHAGTVDADKVEHWIRFCVGMVDQQPGCQPYRAGKKTERSTLAWVLRDLKLPEATRAFFMARRKAFAEADAARAAGRPVAMAAE